jgi:hypothetical protein
MKIDKKGRNSNDLLKNLTQFIAPLLGIRGSRVFGFAQKKKP